MHYHIRWSNTKLDWERFRTRQEAEQAARQLARPGETFALEQVHDGTCVQCLKLWASGRQPGSCGQKSR
jgi:hypothetical protein